ncbi:MAG: Mur ligase family protein, partial [Clostridium perfringens]|nr:Mur ligase family protein [Clostridium perfringens]
MLELNLQEIVKATKGVLLKEADVKEIKAVSTDTRKIEEGTMFIALKGENFNGNNYVLEAFNKGAKIAIVDEVKCDLNELKEDVALIKVQNTGRALMDLAKFYREKLGLKVVGITGSNGKTTTTTMIGEVLTAAGQHGLLSGNIGYPASQVAQTASDKDTLVMELSSFQLMGVQEFHPEIAVITNLMPTHIDYHG